MKCHAGVEFPQGKPCPKCNAKLGEVCWPGINADLAELPKLRRALEDVIRDINEYERVNNLAPNPGRSECWDSVARAKALLSVTSG